MHAIRSKARRSAWTTDDGKPNYNPFARVRAHSQDSERSGLRRTQTETALQYRIEDGGRSKGRLTEHEFSGPTHANTEPEISHSPVLPPIATHTSVSPKGDGARKRRTLRRILRKDTEEVEKPTDLVEEKRKATLSRKIPIGHQFRAVFLGSWINLLLPMIPIGFAVNYTHKSPVTVFCVNFIAIIPSGALLGFSTGEVTIRVGDKFAALLNMTFNNAVQLITSIFLLKARQITVLQSSLLGSILSNLLLMTGLGFLIGGIKRVEQYFSAPFAQTISMLLLLAVTSLIVPTAAHLMTTTTSEGILAQSRGTSVVILISYALWLFFQIKTNRSMFVDPPRKGPERESFKAPVTVIKSMATVGAASAAFTGGHVNRDRPDRDPNEEAEIIEPQLSLWGAITAMILSVTLVAFNTQFATDSIQGLLEHAHIPQTFLGLVILPILSNDPTSIVVANQDKMDMSIALTLERCMQTSLMIVPLVVLLGWCMDINMSLQFDGFSIAALFASIVIVTYVVQEGKSNWLMGALLVKVFIIISLAAFYIHDQ